MLRMAQLVSERTAAAGQPCIQFHDRQMTAVLHVLSDSAFLARGDITGHITEKRALTMLPVTLLTLVDRRFHVVVDTPMRRRRAPRTSLAELSQHITNRRP